MVKRHSNLFDKITDKENLRLAFKKASRGKRWQSKVKKIEENLDAYIDELHETLTSGSYKTSEYKTKMIYEPKARLIYILPFYPDRVTHHAVMNVLAPIFEGMFYDNSYACREGKGQHAGSRRIMEFVRRYKYALQCDISKFYPSVNHKTLKGLLARKFKDKRLLALLFEIIDSPGGETNVPIGNYLSQWFGNYYLTELDRFVYERLHCKGYIRYCDDFCLFGNDKRQLREWADGIERFIGACTALRLSKRRVYPVAQGVDMLGYRHFPKYILVRKRTAKRIRKRLNEAACLMHSGKITKERVMSKVASADGWLRHAQCHNLALALHVEELKKEAREFVGG